MSGKTSFLSTKQRVAVPFLKASTKKRSIRCAFLCLRPARPRRLRPYGLTPRPGEHAASDADVCPQAEQTPLRGNRLLSSVFGGREESLAGLVLVEIRDKSKQKILWLSQQCSFIISESVSKKSCCWTYNAYRELQKVRKLQKSAHKC